MTRRFRWFVGAAALAFFLWPFPDTDRLFRVAPTLRDAVWSVKGASFAVFLDPTHWYRFRAEPATIDALARDLSLTEPAYPVLSVKALQENSPLPWNAWWWQPHVTSGSFVLEGNNSGDQLLLLYDPATHIAYFMVQNT